MERDTSNSTASPILLFWSFYVKMKNKMKKKMTIEKKHNEMVSTFPACRPTPSAVAGLSSRHGKGILLIILFNDIIISVMNIQYFKYIFNKK